MGKSISMKFDSNAADAALDSLLTNANSAIRPAVQSGAQVLYDEVKLNVSRLGKKTGNLERSIYQVFSEAQSTPQHATYHISWNASKAPHGGLVEFGHVQTRKVYIGSDGNWYTSPALLSSPKHVAARPFLRPAFDAKAQAALEAASDRFVQEMKADR